MSQVDAIFQDGVFKPLDSVTLPENQRVRLNVQPIDSSDARAWLAQVQARQEKIIAERGYFPDSTTDIAEDRTR